MKYNIEALKRKMLVKYPFFGGVIASVDYREFRDLSVYAATDGKTIYYNPERMEPLSVAEQICVLAHEVCHIAFNHIIRSEGKNLELWNIATDAVVNQFLKRDGLKLAPGFIDIAEAINYDAEQFYEKLLQENQQKQKDENQNDNNEQGENNQQLDGQLSKRIRESQEQSGDSQDQQSQQQGAPLPIQFQGSPQQSKSKQQQSVGGSHQQNSNNQQQNGNNQQQSKSNQQQNGNNQQQTKSNQQQSNDQQQQSKSNQQQDGDKQQQFKSNQQQSDDQQQQSKSNPQQNGSSQQQSKSNQQQDGDNQQQTQSPQKEDGDVGKLPKKEEEKKNDEHAAHSMWKKTVKEHKEEQEEVNKQEKLEKEKNGIEKMQEELEKVGEKKAFKKNIEIRKKQLEELKEAISRQASKAGTSTSANNRVVNEIGNAKPLIDWRYILRETIKYDVDWSYKNATIEDGFVRPNLESQPMPETEIVLDTSGSINEVLLRNFLRECKNILQNTKLKVGCFDTRFYGFYEIRSEDDIENMRFIGGGGTDFNAAVGAFSRRVDNKIIFTDGKAPMPKTPLNAVWIVFGRIKISPAGGRVIQITPEQLDKLCAYRIENEIKGRSR